jgi:hypothetical protein
MRKSEQEERHKLAVQSFKQNWPHFLWGAALTAFAVWVVAAVPEVIGIIAGTAVLIIGVPAMIGYYQIKRDPPNPV